VYFKTIRWWLAALIQESRQFFVAEFSGVDTACLPDIIIEMNSRECNMHLRTIGQRLAAPIHMVLKGQPVFRS
jgi:hypothetical protein